MNFDGIGEEEEYEPVSTPERPASPSGCGCRSGCLGVFLILSFVFLVGVFILLVFVPSWLNSPGGKAWTEAKVNSALAPAKLSVDQWKISWLGPTEFTGVQYRAPETGVEVKADKITSSLGFLRLLPIGVLNLGDIAVEHPVCTVHPPSHTPQEGKQEAEGTLFLPVADFAARVSVLDGELTVFQEEGGTPFHADTIFAHAAIPSYRKPISLDLRLRSGKEGHHHP